MMPDMKLDKLTWLDLSRYFYKLGENNIGSEGVKFLVKCELSLL